MPTYPKDVIADLIDGKLPWEQTKRIQSSFKDTDRFDTYVQVLQEKVAWNERILLPIGEHLSIVQKGPDRIVKCDCGHEFGDYHRNWKLGALIYDRNPKEIYPGVTGPDPGRTAGTPARAKAGGGQEPGLEKGAGVAWMP